MAQSNYNNNNMWSVADQGQVNAHPYQATKSAHLGSINVGQVHPNDAMQANPNTWNWGVPPTSTPEQYNSAGWGSTYPAVHQNAQPHTNTAYPQSFVSQASTTSTVINNFNDAWNWGQEDENETSRTHENNINNQPAPIAQNMDEQLNENYQRWNLAQHFQYDWSQTQNADAPNFSTLPPTLGQESNINWNNTASTDINWATDGDKSAEESATTDVETIQSDNIKTDVYTGESTLENSVVNKISSAAFEDQGSVAAYFHHGSDEDCETKELVENNCNQKENFDCNQLGTKMSELTTEGHVNPPWASYLRADSWMSNSSLVTYNRSFTGSQEFLLSGSLYGAEDDANNRGSAAGLCQSIDELHISPHQGRHGEMTHPLHISYSGKDVDLANKNPNIEIHNEELSKDTDSSLSQNETITLNDEESVSNQIEKNLEIIPTQSDNVEVPDNCFQADDNAEKPEEISAVSENVNQPWTQEDVTNQEVPLAVVEAQAKKSSSEIISAVKMGISDAENLEVIDKQSVKTDIQSSSLESIQGMSWSRENSAFQPPVASNVRTPITNPVIQREILDDVPTRDTCKHVGAIANETEGVNLEMVPDNAERPTDTELVPSNKTNAPRTHRINAHSSTARHRQADLKAPSPGTTLWDSPDLGGNIGNVLVSPAKGSVLKGPTQSALVVPKLAAQNDNSGSLLAPTTLAQPSVQRNQLVDNSLQRQMAVGGSNEGPTVSLTAASPLDLSSRAAPQGRSFIDDESQRRSRLEPTTSSRDIPDQQQSVPPMSSINNRTLDMEGRPHNTNYMGNNTESDNSRQWRQGSRNDYLRDEDRDWENRQRHRGGWNNDYNRRSGSGGEDGGVGGRRDDGGGVDSRDFYNQSQWRRDSRDWDRDPPPPTTFDPYYRRPYPRPERDRSRPSSRASNQDYESDRYYDRRDNYVPVDDGRGPPPRPSSRSGYESDHGADRHSRYDPSYSAYYGRDPHYQGYNDYMRYPGNPYPDPRQYANQYYGMSAYDYGYYAELYGNDPRYRAYYDSIAKGYYWQQQQYQQQYDDYDRRSVHSGRSSVTDDSRNSQIRRDSKDYSADISGSSSNLNQTDNQREQSALAYDDTYLSQSGFSEFSEQISAGVDILAQHRLTPTKYSSPHVRASFSPCGKLAIVLPNSVLDGQPASVEVCDAFINDQSLNLMGASVNDEFSSQLSDFPGPLIRGDTHKNDVIQFCLQKIKKAKADVNLPDRESCVLIWELLILLIRQNGVVVGTDIAELLLKNQNISESEQSRLNPVDETLVTETLDYPVADPLSRVSNDTNKFLEFLLYGHKKDALEFAMKRGIWGHALFLASKMDTRTYAMVMTRFANSLKFNHPLQTLYQLMSGRQPAAMTNIADEKWGDWRPHLAIILSNSTQRPELDRRSVVTLGDTLATKGCLHAAHFCYLMAQLEFGNFAKKSSKLVLIGANHSLPFSQFATEEAIQCTEIYEYVQSLANPQFVLSHLQFYKFLYAIRLVDAGYPQKALHYCEIVASVIKKWPNLFDSDLARQVYELAYRLKYHDPHYLQEEGEIADIGDPLWLRDLATVIQSYNSGSFPTSEYLDQKLPNEFSESTVTSDAYGLDAAATGSAESSAYQNQPYLYGTATDPNIGYINQQSVNVFSNAPTQQQENTNFKNTAEDYAYSTTNNINQQGIETYQTSNAVYNYGNYYGAQTTNLNQQGINENPPELSVDPEIDYYGASTFSNTISPVNASTPKVPDHKQLRRKSSTDATAADSNTYKDQPIVGNKSKQLPSKSADGKEKPKQGGSWLGGIFSKFSLRPKNQMILPDDKNPKIVWDPKTNRWTNLESGEEEEENPALAAPPKDLEVQKSSVALPHPSYEPNQMTTDQHANAPPTLTSNENRYKLRPGRGMRNNYVDVLSGNVVPVQPNVSLAAVSAPATNTNYPVQFLVPLPVAGNGNSSTDFITTSNVAPAADGEETAHLEPHNNVSEPNSNVQSANEQVESSHPMMYNPSMLQASNTSNVSSGLQRYGRRPR